jgi:two-component system sensor kinase FixL
MRRTNINHGGAKKSRPKAPPKRKLSASGSEVTPPPLRSVEKKLQKHKTMLAAADRLLQNEIAKRRAADVDLRDSRARLTSSAEAWQYELSWLRGLIETTQDAVITIDREGKITFFNPAAERMFGYSPPEIVGQKVNVLMAQPYAREHDSYIEGYERTGEAHAIGQIRTVEARRKNGDPFPIELSVTKVIGESGDIRYAALIRDISEKKKLQQQVIDGERLAAVGITAAKLGHEVANPLNGMSVTVQMLERRLIKLAVDDEILKSGLRNVQHEIRRLTELLNEYRVLYRREKYVFEPTSLSDLLTETLELQGSRYETLGIFIENNIPGDLPFVNVDVEKLKQVLLNLLKNSTEAMPSGGRITLSAHADAGQIVLEIKDTGAGIPLGVDIFEPFTTTKSNGTGLGLVIVRQILTAHGATISYSSEPGKGTKFYLKFPTTLPALGEMA